MQLIRALVPSMRARGWGRILNISSAMAFKAGAFNPEYAAAKIALHSLATSLADELGDCGVTINTLVCGLVWTEATQKSMKERAALNGFTETGLALERRLCESFGVPLRRAGRQEEVAAAACFLVSELAAYITGASLRVDGGSSRFVN